MCSSDLRRKATAAAAARTDSGQTPCSPPLELESPHRAILRRISPHVGPNESIHAQSASRLMEYPFSGAFHVLFIFVTPSVADIWDRAPRTPLPAGYAIIEFSMFGTNLRKETDSYDIQYNQGFS